jgi:hypothetical protein
MLTRRGAINRWNYLLAALQSASPVAVHGLHGSDGEVSEETDR